MAAENRIARSQRGGRYVECYHFGDIGDKRFQLVVNFPVTRQQVEQALRPDPVLVGPVEQGQLGTYVVGLFDDQFTGSLTERPAQWTEAVLLACA